MFDMSIKGLIINWAGDVFIAMRYLPGRDETKLMKEKVLLLRMGSSSHNVCHLMNIAQCMQLPDLQYEISLKHSLTLTHTHTRSHSSFKGFADVSHSSLSAPPGGHYNTYSRTCKDETRAHAKVASSQLPLTRSEKCLPGKYSFTKHTVIRL